MDGTDDPENLVKVTVEQHAALHKQLWEDLGHEEDRIAWLCLSGQITSQDAIKKAISLAQKGKKKSQSVIDAIIESNKRRRGEKHHLWGKKRPPETIQKMIEGHKGQVPWNKNRKSTPEEIEKNRIGQLNRKKCVCPYCNKLISGTGNLNQHIRGKHKSKEI